MPRPKLVTDDEVLDAANRILFERGGTDFTLADVARAVGLSRAALIQRFDNRDAILRRMAAREVEATRAYLASLPVERSAAGLWSFLTEIVGSMGSGQGFSARVQLAWMETRDAELKRMAAARYAMVQAAIAERMPPATEDPAALARALHGVIAGATMQWVVSDHPDLSAYVMDQLGEVLARVFPATRFA